MQLLVESPENYLGSDDVVDCAHPVVAALADALRTSTIGEVGYARAAFEYVRDEVGHSIDVQDPRVTISASSVATERVGLCYAKSHLLAALLRARGIPTGLCYQRLTDDGSTHMVHGLVAVYLGGVWHRQDPRGSRPGVDAQFSLGTERLAWPVRPDLGECDYPEVFVRPDAGVVAALRGSTDVLALCAAGLPTELTPQVEG